MLAKQLKRVTEIDARINDIHRELGVLYEERAELLDNKLEKATPTDSRELYRQRWIDQQYQHLGSIWGKYGVKLPAKKTLQSKLGKAYDTIAELSVNVFEFENTLSVVLVPPTKSMEFPVYSAWRESQNMRVNDFVNADLPKPASQKGWRLLVVFSAPQGLYLGSPASIIKDKKYEFAGVDMRALGVNEYAALSLQNPEIDAGSWSVLLKNTINGNLVACAGRVNNHFRFDLVESNSVFGDDRFRPAVEIK